MYILVPIIVFFAILTIVLGYKLREKEKGSIWQSLSVATTLLIVAATIYYSGKTIEFTNRTIELTKKQISLQLRPFISVTYANVEFVRGYERNWLRINCKIKNFGVQPAHEYHRLNDKAIIVKIPPELLNELEKIKSDANSTLTEKDVAFENIINYGKKVMKEIYKYLLSNPMATSGEITEKFNEATLKCYGDIWEYFSPPSVISPNQEKKFYSTRDIGGKYGRELAAGREILMYFVYLEYEGALLGKKYTTFYIGYYDENVLKKYRGDPHQLQPLAEYRQWMEREDLN